MASIKIIDPDNELEQYEVGDYVYNIPTGNVFLVAPFIDPQSPARMLFDLSNGSWIFFKDTEKLLEYLSGTAFRKLKPGTEIRITID